MFKQLLLLLSCFSLLNLLSAQDSCLLMVQNFVDKEINAAVRRFPETEISTIEANEFLQDALGFLYEKGYLSASYSEKKSGDTCLIDFQKGKPVYWASLDVSNVDAVFLNNAGYKKKDFENHLFRYNEVTDLYKKMLDFAEENGYPFAVAGLTNIIWQDSSISAELFFRKNYLIHFDTLIIKGNLSINANYLEQYTGIHPDAVYDQLLINGLDGRLREIPFANLTRPTQIEFSGNKAKVVVFLDEKKVSRFDFLIGVLPNNEITGRLIVTGEGKLNLENAFGAGEIFNLYFSKLESSSKQFTTSLTYPYLPKIPFGADGSFNLFLRDSTFLERSSSLGIIYHFSGSNYLKAFTSFYNSTVLSFDTSLILITKTLPSTLDNSNITYGLNWVLEHLDYKFNPQKGFDFSLGGAAGTKTIQKNNAITSLNDPFDPEFDFNTLYDSIDLKTLIVNYNYNLRLFIPTFKRNTILLQARGAAIMNNQVLQNELFRLGGNALLRGFDEQSVLASTYHILTAEYRFLFLQNSFAGVFFDGGFVEDKSVVPVIKDYPYGFGTGVSFETKAGIFGLSYALGSRLNNPIQIKNAKIHFGYLNYF